MFGDFDEGVCEALSSDPSIQGMQYAMLQPDAPSELLVKAAQLFQRSW